MEWEKDILNMVGFRLTLPTAAKALNAFMYMLGTPPNVNHVATYLSDLCLTDVDLLK